MWMDILKALQVSCKEYILPCSMTSTNCTLYDKLIQSLHHQSCTITNYQWILISLTHGWCINFKFQNELWQPWYLKKKKKKKKNVAKTLFHTKFSDKTVTVNTTTRLFFKLWATARANSYSQNPFNRKLNSNVTLTAIQNIYLRANPTTPQFYNLFQNRNQLHIKKY
jgi:hypothetical protein